ncbi:MAG TPA: hypothetical protein VNG51_16275 [Ktedonobacteraceae bacterium]|nr:hypothetical protein [Ktedonobacteraceae bacterium]
MKARLLYQFPGTISEKDGVSPRAWHWPHGKGDRCAVVYVSDVVAYPSVETLSLVLVDPHTGNTVKHLQSTYHFGHIEELHLTFDSVTQNWVLGDVELQTASFDYHAVLRVVRDEPDNQGLFFASLFDEAPNDDATTGPLFDLFVEGNRYMFLLRKTATMERDTPQVLCGSVNVDLRQKELTSLLYAESAAVRRQERRVLVVALKPQRSQWATQRQRGYDSWGFVLSICDPLYQEKPWSEALPLSLPIPVGVTSILNQGIGNDFEWLGVNAAAIIGPAFPGTTNPTWCAGMTMMDVFRLERGGMGHSSVQASLIPRSVSALLYLDTTGNILQTCLNPLGLRVQLARVDEMIVGVDLSSGRWRLWNWAPIQETTWRVVLLLDPLVTRAHVVTAGEQEQDGLQCTFWLIEELEQMLRISKRDVFTLKEVDTPALIPHVHLVEPQLGAGALDWPTEIDACVYQGKLLISGVDESQHLVLYQVG